MTASTEGQVAAYIDFDNIVIPRYNQRHGNGQFQRDKVRSHSSSRALTSVVGIKLGDAEVVVEVLLDYASSFGTVALSRAQADWSVPVNSGYQKQLINRAVELVQLFPLTAQRKNGADIRIDVSNCAESHAACPAERRSRLAEQFSGRVLDAENRSFVRRIVRKIHDV